ncbi:qcr9 subunit 9 of the ubiquinol cytochrome-c reductase complex [Blastocladiella emersonii ATCC 22665]|nr:qcr9 subunit 9 of the ubiquinol cytochrome-c reductase complex [Blastocladiella emersonii ATCC 22665]
MSSFGMSTATAGGGGDARPAAMSQAEQGFHHRLDAELRALRQNMEAAFDLARMGGRDRLAETNDELQLQYRTTAILRSAHTITAMATQLKQLLLLGDVASRHALVAQRAHAVQRTTADNKALLAKLALEAADAANEIDECLWLHCAPETNPLPRRQRARGGPRRPRSSPPFIARRVASTTTTTPLSATYRSAHPSTTMAAPETGITRTIYNSFLRRNTVFVGTLFVTAFAFEVAYDKFTNSLWESRNKGKLWKDIKDNYGN